MARKVQISKEIILQAALDMLIRDGYSSINIKTLAKEIGCSTQPIVWHFDNMEGFRDELAEYALNYANNKMRPKEGNAMEAFEQVGIAYVQIAVREPNLFRFLYLDGYNGICADNFSAITSGKDNKEMIERIASYLQISEENIGRYLMNTIIYTHGIAALVATGVIKATEDEMMELVNRAADAFILQEGVPVEKIQKLGEEKKE